MHPAQLSKRQFGSRRCGLLFHFFSLLTAAEARGRGEVRYGIGVGLGGLRVLINSARIITNMEYPKSLSSLQCRFT